jgi:predicted NBD/HSP70 family sugar kinase
MQKSGISLQKMKKKNMLSIFHAIREHGPVSRIEVGRILDLSNTTSIELTKELLSQKLIVENGTGDSTGGRRPVLLEINWNYRNIIGVIMSANEISCGIYNLQLKKIRMLKYKLNLSKKELISAVYHCVVKILNDSGVDHGMIAGMTIGVAGIVDTVKGNIISSTHFHSKETISVSNQFKNLFTFPVYLENYGHLLALTEKKAFFPNAESLVFIQVDEGIGGGITKDNAVFQGAFGYAGEIGHISIDPRGPDCFCGNRGCAETMGSIPAFLEKAAMRLRSGEKSLINDFSHAGGLDINAIARAFHKKDKLAEELVNEEADVLYQIINSIILTYDPEIIVLSGDIVCFS